MRSATTLCSADFTTRPDAGGYAARLAWGYRRHIPNFALSASHETRVRDGGQFYANQRHPLREDVSTLAGSVGLFVSRSGHAGSLSARLTGAWFRPTENATPRFDPLDPVPVLPEASRTTDLSIGLSYRQRDARLPRGHERRRTGLAFGDVACACATS
jgi:hypothetical protein